MHQSFAVRSAGFGLRVLAVGANLLVLLPCTCGLFLAYGINLTFGLFTSLLLFSAVALAVHNILMLCVNPRARHFVARCNIALLMNAVFLVGLGLHAWLRLRNQGGFAHVSGESLFPFAIPGLTILALIGRWSSIIDPWQCPTCLYDLRGSVGQPTCPECGQPIAVTPGMFPEQESAPEFDPAWSRYFLVRWWRRDRFQLMVVMGLIVLVIAWLSWGLYQRHRVVARWHAFTQALASGDSKQAYAMTSRRYQTSVTQENLAHDFAFVREFGMDEQAVSIFLVWGTMTNSHPDEMFEVFYSGPIVRFMIEDGEWKITGYDWSTD